MAINSYNYVNIALPEEYNQQTNLPCSIGVVSNLFGNYPNIEMKSLFDRHFINVDCNNFNQFIKKIRPGVSVLVNDLLVRQEKKKTQRRFDLRFECIEDFQPASLISQIEPLSLIYEKINIIHRYANRKEGLAWLCTLLHDLVPIHSYLEAKEEDLILSYPTPIALQEARLEDKIRTMGKAAYTNYPGKFNHENGTINYEKIVMSVLSLVAGAMQRLLADQLDLIIKDPEFKKLEASYLGIKTLCDEIKKNNKDNNIQLRVLPATWSEITKDLEKAPSLERGNLFSKIYDRLDSPGEQPFTLIIWDYTVSQKISKESGVSYIDTLKNLSFIAAASFCPFIFAAEPELFGIAEWGDFNPQVRLNDLFSLPEYLKWNELRKNIDSRFINIMVPNVLLRLPYYDSYPIQPGVTLRENIIRQVIKPNFYFEEEINTENDYLWSHAGYHLGCVIARSFSATGWFEHIKGVPKGENELGGVFPNLVFGPDNHVPRFFERHQRQYNPSMGTNFLVTQDIEMKLSDFGYISVASNPVYKSGVLFNLSSLYDPGISQKNVDEWAASRMSSSLNFVLCASRFAHFLRIICRDKIGGLTSAPNLQDYLQKWVINYIKSDIRRSIAGEKSVINRPLADASITVTEKLNHIGAFVLEVDLQPFFESENIISTIRLTSEIATRA